jgi:RNA polymerase sigma factor (sigma-70 family)
MTNSASRESSENHTDVRWRLFLEERARLLAYVRRLAPAGCDGGDVVQEVGLRLLCHDDVSASRTQLVAWCKAVARHIVLHELRAKRYERAKLAALDNVSVPDAWESEWRAAVRSTVAGELDRMDALSRELVVRRYVLEQTSNEIAQEVNLSPAAVRMRLMRIRGGGEALSLGVEDASPLLPRRPSSSEAG